MSAQPIPYYGPAATDLSGALACWVEQPADNALQEDSSGNVHYARIFKGPYENGKNLLNQIGHNSSMSEVEDALSSIVNRIDPPACPTKYGLSGQWKVDTVQIQELEAGAHCLLRVDFYNYVDTTDILGGQKIETENLWNLSWQSYTVSPYAYCSNEEHHDQKVTSQSYGASWMMPAMKSHIDKYFQRLDGNFEGGTEEAPIKTYSDNGSTMRYMNPAECLIADKISIGKEPVFHFPVLTHQTATQYPRSNSGPIKYSEEVGGEIDYTLSAVPADCPYTFKQIQGKDWKWLKVGDDVQCQKTDAYEKFTRTETWWGALDWDPNFYGNAPFSHNYPNLISCRWEIGRL